MQCGFAEHTFLANSAVHLVAKLANDGQPASEWLERLSISDPIPVYGQQQDRHHLTSRKLLNLRVYQEACEGADELVKRKG